MINTENRIFAGGGKEYDSPVLEVFGINVENGFAQTTLPDWSDGTMDDEWNDVF